MRPRHEVDEVLGLIGSGLSDRETSSRTGNPRRTVGDWRRGRHPYNGEPSSRVTDHARPLPEHEYVYILGMYLGYGCLSPGLAQGVWRLRIFADTKHAHRLARRDCGCVEVSMAEPEMHPDISWRQVDPTELQDPSQALSRMPYSRSGASKLLQAPDPRGIVRVRGPGTEHQARLHGHPPQP